MPYYAPFYRPTYYDPVQQNPMGQYNPQYQQMMNQPMQPAPMPAQPSNEFLWVLNENEATSYPVAPNNTVILWDKNLPTVYIKSVNAQGVSSMRVLDFTERAATATKQPPVASFVSPNSFVTLDSFNALEAKFDALEGKVEELRTKASTNAKKVEVENDA